MFGLNCAYSYCTVQPPWPGWNCAWGGFGHSSRFQHSASLVHSGPEDVAAARGTDLALICRQCLPYKHSCKTVDHFWMFNLEWRGWINKVNHCPECLTFAVSAGTCWYWCLNMGLYNWSPLTSSKSHFGNTSKTTKKRLFFQSNWSFLFILK